MKIKDQIYILVLADFGSVSGQGWARDRYVVALWEAFYIENEHCDLDTLRVPDRSPTPMSSIDDFVGLFDDIWGPQTL